MRNLWLLPTLGLTLLSSQLKADTYKVYLLDNFANGAQTILGLTDSGQVAISQNGFYDYTYMRCRVGNICFVTYTPGGGASFSADPPSLTYDSGYSCVTFTSPSTCNGARNAYTEISGSRHGAFLFEDTGTDTDFIFSGQDIQQLKINKYGDVAFVDNKTLTTNIYEAVDLTTRITPEPSTFALLGTGLLGSLAAIRRRLNH